MERELSQLRQALNFPDFAKFRLQTDYERYIKSSGQSKTWHKMKEIVSTVETHCGKKIDTLLVLSNMSTPVVHLRCLCPGVDWYLVQEWMEGDKPTWLNTKFPRRCLSGWLYDNNSCYWNNGRIWETDMVNFYVSMLTAMKWQPEVMICDMCNYGVKSDKSDAKQGDKWNEAADDEEDNQEEKQLQVKMAEMKLCLNVLKLGGTIIMKLLGVSHPQTRHVVSCLSTVFDQVELCKLKGSNPLNSELYLFCYGLHSRSIATTSLKEEAEVSTSASSSVAEEAEAGLQHIDSQVEQMCQLHIQQQVSEIKKFLHACQQQTSSPHQSQHRYYQLAGASASTSISNGVCLDAHSHN